LRSRPGIGKGHRGKERKEREEKRKEGRIEKGKERRGGKGDGVTRITTLLFFSLPALPWPFTF